MYEVIAIGASWGGLEAMGTLLEGIPQDLDQAIVVAQHRSPEASRGVLEALLQRHVERPVTEPSDKELIEPGRVYVAPPDYHLLVDGGRFALSVEGRVQFARPSIDVLFESVADGYREQRDRNRAHRCEQGRSGRPRRDQAERRCLDRPGSTDGEQADDARRGARSLRGGRRAAARGDRPLSLRVVLPMSEGARSCCWSTTGRRTSSRSRRSSSRWARSSSASSRARRRCDACSTTSTP